MRWFLLSLIVAATASPAVAQILPYHADPSAREEAPDLSAVPAIRFLTSTGYPPFNYRDTDGQLIGFHIDLANAICKVLDISCTMQAWPWDQVADALADNQGDALIAGLAIDPVTAERFDFSDIYLMYPARFAVRAEGAAAGASPEVPEAGTVAVRAGSAHAGFLAEYRSDLEQIPFETEAGALDAMRQGRADAWFGDALRASFWLNENPGCCAFAGDAYFNPRYFGEGLAIAIPAGRGAVREAINFALQRLKRNGRFDELYLRWFPVSFY